MPLSETEKRAVRAAFDNRTVSGKWSRVLVNIWIFVSLILAFPSGEYLFLCFHTGFLRVVKEHIHIVSSPTSHSIDDWILSNGEHISHSDGFGMFLATIVVWVGLLLAGCVAIGRFSAKRKRARLEKMLNDA